MKPVNFQWTVLRCDIQVAQELNRGGARVIPDLLQAPLPIFKRRESDNARKMREGGAGGASSFKIKKGKTLRGTDGPCHVGAHRIHRIAAPLAEETL